jgi:hypothetical protein
LTVAYRRAIFRKDGKSLFSRREGDDTMRGYVLVRHKVSDFTAWKKIYDGHLSKRLEAGLTERNLFRSEGDTNEVLILFEAKDIGRARKFTESTDLRETMEKAGVIDKPDVYILNDASSVQAKAA